MNPLKRQQEELLERIGCADLGRKVNEIVNYLNNSEPDKMSKQEKAERKELNRLLEKYDKIDLDIN